MKKGFTLIELLAVIVILAIIALIAVPIVLNIINDAKISANKNSIDMYAKAIENSFATYMLGNNDIENLKGIYTTSTLENLDGLRIDYQGNVECEIIRVYDDLSFYLSNCKNNGDLVYTDSSQKEIYSYGKKLNPFFAAKSGTLLSKIAEYNEVHDAWKNIPGIYKTIDDYGETLVYRGSVDNNYVKFANILWRIVRINGDGSIRLITANGVGTSSFCGVNSKNFEYPEFAKAAYTSNRVDGGIGDSSTIKTYVDNWYTNNLTSVDSYIQTAQYCQPFNYNKEEMATDFDPPWGRYAIYNESNIKCLGSNTDFGGEYQLKVGLLNYSEFYFSEDAIAIEQPYWIMQAYDYHDSSARIDLYGQHDYYGDIRACDTTAFSPTFGTLDIVVRPVINLKSNVLFKSGNGKESSPYEIIIN